MSHWTSRCLYLRDRVRDLEPAHVAIIVAIVVSYGVIFAVALGWLP